MRTFSLLKDLPVFELPTGEQLGVVCDLAISATSEVTGLLIKSGPIIKRRQFISINNVESFGEDGVMVKCRTKLQQVNNNCDYTLLHNERLYGKEVMSAEGERLGLLEDVYFSTEVGTIVGYELTDGFFSDVIEGKRVIKTSQPPSIGKETIIVNLLTDHNSKGV